MVLVPWNEIGELTKDLGHILEDTGVDMINVHARSVNGYRKVELAGEQGAVEKVVIFYLLFTKENSIERRTNEVSHYVQAVWDSRCMAENKSAVQIVIEVAHHRIGGLIGKQGIRTLQRLANGTRVNSVIVFKSATDGIREVQITGPSAAVEKAAAMCETALTEGRARKATISPILHMRRKFA